MVSELGERLSLDSGTLTPLLKRLEAASGWWPASATRRRTPRAHHPHAAGRKLKTRAQRIPGCILQASQCSSPKLMALTQQVQALRQRLTA
jgi:hypothetical protein